MLCWAIRGSVRRAVRVRTPVRTGLREWPGRDEEQGMTIDLDAPKALLSCDLCCQEADLFRLFDTVDALCERCFGMLHA